MKYKIKNKIYWFFVFFRVFFGAFGSIEIGVQGMKFKGELECHLEVVISDKEKAKAFYLEGEWKDYFVNPSFSTFTSHVACAFLDSCEEFTYSRFRRRVTGIVRSVEPVGTFQYDSEKNEWRLIENYEKVGEPLLCGEIIIRFLLEPYCNSLHDL